MTTTATKPTVTIEAINPGPSEPPKPGTRATWPAPSDGGYWTLRAVAEGMPTLALVVMRRDNGRLDAYVGPDELDFGWRSAHVDLDYARWLSFLNNAGARLEDSESLREAHAMLLAAWELIRTR